MTNIRRFRDTDAAQLRNIYCQAVTHTGAKAYTPDQIAAWLELAPATDRFVDIMNDGRISLIATDDTDRPVAFCDLEADGHIVLLYALPEVSGTGTTARLYEAIEAEARKQGIGKLYSEASELAKGFLLKKGFKVVERRDFEISGVAIHNYAVEKRLNRTS